jgi:hypothetical protein
VKKSFDSIAYPNNDSFMNIPGQHPLPKWIQTVKEIYYNEKNGIDRRSSIQKCTSGWNEIEVFDFLNWLKYYEGNEHMKYKKAQSWYVNDSMPGYFLNIKNDSPDSAPNPGDEISNTRDSLNQLSSSEKKRIIEKQRNKLIGRLDSAEKLLRSDDGQLFAGKEFEALLEALYGLKKKIQMINKVSVSTQIYDDLIVRAGNKLNKNGFIKAASILYSLANGEEPPVKQNGIAGDNEQKPPSDIKPVEQAPLTEAPPAVAPPNAPTTQQGAPNNTYTTTTIGTNKPPAAEGPQSDNNTPSVDSLIKSPGAKAFLDNMGVDDIEVLDSDDDFVVEAQALPTAPATGDLEVEEPITTNPEPEPLNPTPDVKLDKPKKEIAPKNLEEMPEEPKEEIEEEPSAPHKDYDSIIDAALSGVTITDIINKLEDLSNIFRKREIPRQLAILDIMLNAIGLASLFPTLSEATNKAMESNNYILTRVDEVLSKLRGMVKTKDILKEPDNKELTPGIESLKNKLQQQENKEKEKKQLRKDIEDKELSNKLKETPELEVEEDLEAPIEPAPAPVPAKPLPVPPPPRI